MRSTSLSLSFDKLKYLSSPLAVRERAVKMYERALSGKTSFEIVESQFEKTASFVIDVTREAYPDFKAIPFHARWEHFKAGGVDRLSILQEKIKHLAPEAQGRCLLDLVFVSVLLDAGAGDKWIYKDGNEGTYTRSEGLAVASFNMFMAGLFSSDSKNPLQVDSKGLCTLRFEDLNRGFQAGHHNPLLGMEGRWELLKRLGHLMEKRPDYFLCERICRVGGLIDYWKKINAGDLSISASQILTTLIFALEGMWTPRIVVNDVSFGDMWFYDFESGNDFENIVPFHKLSQWLSYSCFYPIEVSGLKVLKSEELTGLPEYRNGGLLIDMGVLKPKDPNFGNLVFQAGDPFIIEWRALTVACLDKLGVQVRAKLGLTETEFPLGKMLQGGTWTAGRKIAAQLRQGLPPIQLSSDGTVF